jgi:glycosyltransferase involved in cell wall biosynthesis
VRIAVFNRHLDLIGGVETCLAKIVPGFTVRGHQILFVHEEKPEGTRRLVTQDDALCVAHLDDLQAFECVKAWKPDLVFVNSFSRNFLISELARAFPLVFFVHDYVGTCINGEKRHKFPSTRPCARHFGPACLALYYPRRCGGWSPLTMWRQYRKRRESLELLRSGACLITASEALRKELLKHDLPPSLVHRLPYVTEARGGKRILPAEPWRLLFLGRMEAIKGGDVLVDAVQAAAEKTGRKLRLLLAGDGSSRNTWQAHAARVSAKSNLVEIVFTGWLEGSELERTLSETDLLVIPSTWPEPFGLVGLEVGAWAIPSVAFDVGGIGEWLHDGVNGVLSSGSPPTRSGLATAIAACLSDIQKYRAMCNAALEAATKHSLHMHVDRVLALFESVCVPGATSRAY